jgi:glycine cleavage system H protein
MLMEAPLDRMYTPDHQWVQLKLNRAILGITDYAQLELGMVVYLELPEIGTKVTIGECYASVETVEGMEDLAAPVSGIIVEINRELERDPMWIHRSPYNRGWLAVIEMSKQDEETNALWSAERYLQGLE